jgi:hypothetical protein
VKRRAIVIHSLDHALAATAAADVLVVPLTLISAAGAAGYLGAPVFAAIIAETRRAHPTVTLTAILDCGDAPGDALNAIRHGTPQSSGLHCQRRFGARSKTSQRNRGRASTVKLGTSSTCST